jgi:thiamine kinase-like enzyme
MIDDEAARMKLSALPNLTAEVARHARLTRLPGLTNHVFKVELESGVFCLRIPGEATEAIIDRRAEEKNARAAATAGITPEIIHFAEDGTMLTRFVDGALATPDHILRSTSALERVASALRELHERTADFASGFRVFKIMESYVAVLEDGGAAFPVGGRDALERAEAVRAALAAHPVALRPCHCDPTGRNLIDTGARVWLVDWEYSAMNEPAWDLATFSIESGLGDQTDRALLSAYFGRPPDPSETARVAVMKVPCELMAALWAMIQSANGNRKYDFRRYAERSFAQAVARMAAPGFARQLGLVGRGWDKSLLR